MARVSGLRLYWSVCGRA